MQFLHCTVWKLREFPLSCIFSKNFVNVTVLLNEILKNWFEEIFFRWERISWFLHCALWGTVWTYILYSLQKIREINSKLHCKLFSRNIFHNKKITWKQFTGLLISRKKMSNGSDLPSWMKSFQAISSESMKIDFKSVVRNRLDSTWLDWLRTLPISIL